MAVAAHRHWRILITANGGDVGFTQIAELELRGVVGGPDLCTGGVASASSAHDATFTADKAFDNSTATKWSTLQNTAFPHWIAYDFGAGNDKNIVQITINCLGTSFNERGPRVFRVQWSDDGVSWTTQWRENKPELTYTSGVAAAFTDPAPTATPAQPIPVALLTGAPTANWLAALKARLEDLYYEPTVVNETDIGTHDFSPYGFIAAAGVSLTNANSVAATLTTLNDGGKPLILDPYHEGMSWSGANYNGVPVAMGLSGLIDSGLSTVSNTITAANSTHPINKTTPPDAVFSFGGAQPFAQYGPETAIGSKLVELTGSGNGQLWVIPPATTKLTSGTTGGRIVLFPMKNEFLGEGAVLLARSLQFLTTGAVVEGPPRIENNKLVGYSVLNYPDGIASSSKLVGYAVLDIEHAQVYSSKMVGYAVLSPDGGAPPPTESLARRRRSATILT